MIDDTLILYYYDDGLSEEMKREVRTALANDEVLAARYRQLVGELSALAEGPVEPVPDDVRARLHVALDRAADLETGRETSSRRPSHWFSFLLGAGLTAALALAIGLGLRDTAGPAATPLIVAETAPAPSEYPAVFTRAVQAYFRDSRAELADLPDAGNGERTAMILQLVDQNRTYARLATQNDAPDLARVLRAFEPILTRLAAADITAEESETLRAKLAFELNVMLTKLTREASINTTSTEQET